MCPRLLCIAAPACSHLPCIGICCGTQCELLQPWPESQPEPSAGSPTGAWTLRCQVADHTTLPLPGANASDPLDLGVPPSLQEHLGTDERGSGSSKSMRYPPVVSSFSCPLSRSSLVTDTRWLFCGMATSMWPQAGTACAAQYYWSAAALHPLRRAPFRRHRGRSGDLLNTRMRPLRATAMVTAMVTVMVTEGMSTNNV
jgi:hypothetical protein